MTTDEQTAMQQIQAQADSLVARANRHGFASVRIGIPACLWRRAGLCEYGRVVITTDQGVRVRAIPVDGLEFQSLLDPWDEATAKVARELEAI